MTEKGKTRKTERALQHPFPAIGRSPWHEMERWFDEFSRGGSLFPFDFDWPYRLEVASAFGGRLPRVDIIDREKELVVRAELPGVKKADLDVTVTEHSVTLKAESKHEEKEEEEYYRREISHGVYLRTLELPHTVDEKKASATFDDGVLELTLPKMEKTPSRKVRVE